MQPKPEWLKIKNQSGVNYAAVNNILNELRLNTVCSEASCPNSQECFSRKTATFLILGKYCTRSCGFCGVSRKTESLPLPDPTEPERIAEAIVKLNLRHAVITSVTRDDLQDGGASHFVKTVTAIKKANHEATVEVLIPDFKGEITSLETVASFKPDVIAHNMETVAELYGNVRPQADYRQSLSLLASVKKINPKIYTKSGFMTGLGETEKQIDKLLFDLKTAECDFLTVGQYLPPSKNHFPLFEYTTPEAFDRIKEKALKIGFKYVAAGPLVRSSYRADEAFNSNY